MARVTYRWRCLGIHKLERGILSAVPQTDMNPVAPIVFGEWHTIVERVDLSPSGNATVNVWLDPDFTQPEDSQPTADYTQSAVIL